MSDQEQKMTVAEKLRLLAELAESGEEFGINKSKSIFSFKGNNLYFTKQSGIEYESGLEVTSLCHCDIIRLPKKPQMNKEVYILNPLEERGYYRSTRGIGEKEYFEMLLKRGVLFVTEEEIIKEVKQRGWVVE